MAGAAHVSPLGTHTLGAVMAGLVCLLAWPVGAQMSDPPFWMFSRNVSGQELTDGRELVDCPPYCGGLMQSVGGLNTVSG